MLALPRRHGLAVTTAALISAAALYFSTQARAQTAEPKPSDQIPEVVVETTAPTKPKSVPAKPKKVAKTAPAPTPEPEPDAAPVAAPVAEPAPPPATALGTFNPALDLPSDFKFPEGTTLTTAGPVYGYRALSAMSATKTATPIEHLPQSIQVIPKSLLEDQRSLTVNEALRNVSNVRGVNDLNIGNTDLQPLKMRGFTAEQWLDGLVVNYNAGDRDAFANIERIEVLKGPNAILYGGGPGAPVGGAVNVISKLPTGTASGEFGFTYGSHNYLQPYFDINQPITANKTVLFRLTGEYTAADSFVDVLEQDRYSINPTLTITDKVDTTLTVQGRFSRFEQQGYQGLPAVGTVAGSFRIDPHLYIGPSDITPSTSEVRSVTVTLDHRFNSIWSANLKARYSESEFDQNTQTTFGAEPELPPSTWLLLNSEVKQEQEEFTINPNLQARFDWGVTRNTLLFGADYSRVTDVGHHYTNNLGNAAFLLGFPVPPATTVNLLDPTFPVAYFDPAPQNSGFEFFTYGDVDNVYKTKGGYAQLQTSIFDTVHLMGGLRIANLQVDYIEKANFVNGLGPVLNFTTDETKLLPRAGAVVDVLNGLSIYGGYSEGMRWPGFGVQFNPADPSPAPEESKQIDTGFKLAFGSQLSGTISFFQIDRTNVPVTLAAGNTISTEQRSRGFETDLIWQPSLNWQVLASYGYVDARFLTAIDEIAKGNRVAEVPEHSGRLWINYAFDSSLLKGWSIGTGIYLASNQFVDSTNIYKTGGFFTVDAKVAYEAENFTAALNVKNLTDEEYFEPYPWFGGQVSPGAERAFYGTVIYKY